MSGGMCGTDGTDETQYSRINKPMFVITMWCSSHILSMPRAVPGSPVTSHLWRGSFMPPSRGIVLLLLLCVRALHGISATTCSPAVRSKLSALQSSGADIIHD